MYLNEAVKSGPTFKPVLNGVSQSLRLNRSFINEFVI